MYNIIFFRRVFAYFIDCLVVSLTLFLLCSVLMLNFNSESINEQAAPFILINLIFLPLDFLFKLLQFPRAYGDVSWIYTFLPLIVFLEVLVYTFIEFSPMKATIGKRIMHLTIKCINDKDLSFVRVFNRNLIKVLSRILFGLPFLVLPFTKKRQAIHDLITNIEVIDK